MSPIPLVLVEQMERLYLNVFKRLCFVFLSALLLLGGSAYYALIYFPHTPLQPQENILTFDLRPGLGCKKIASQLQTEKLFSTVQASCFCWWVQYQGAQKSLQAGEYAIPLNITPQNLLAKLKKGEVIQYSVTIKEGITVAQLQSLLQSHPKLKKVLSEEVLATIKEGEYFPDTYYFTANTPDTALLARAKNAMQIRLQTAWDNRAPECILKTPYEALILASIIEKETAEDNERSMISGVFQRRMAKNMRLQADPTVAYGIPDLQNGSLTKAHLQYDTPYNTYIHKGLPPTPIALPGLKSIIAALHPDKGESLYFVAKEDKGHYFSDTLIEHNKAVANYRERQRKTKGNGANQ